MRRVLLLSLIAGVLFGCKTMSFDELKSAVLSMGKTESTQIVAPSSLSDREVCSYALTTPSKPLDWESGPKWDDHVKEAIRRDLNLLRCADLTGRNMRVATAESKETVTPSSRPAAEVQPPRKRLPRELVMSVQRCLTDLGIDPGPIDGLEGKRTRTAVKSFQRSMNLAETGEISKDLLGRLRHEVAAATKLVSASADDAREADDAPQVDEAATPIASTEEVLQAATPEKPVLGSQETAPVPQVDDVDQTAETAVDTEATELVNTAAAENPIQVNEGSAEAQTAETPPAEAAPTGEAAEVAKLVTETTPKPSQPEPLTENAARYHALIIGNNEYEHLPDLDTAQLDAQALAKLLRDDYGFDVNMLLNANRGEILEAFSEMRHHLTESDSLLVYYGGHGILDLAAERGYWLPVDAEENINTNWISNADITDVLKATDALHVLVVADSCYSGTLVRAGAPPMGTQRRDALLKRLALKKSRTVMTSGGLEPVVDGGGGGHSVFANALLSVLAENKGMVEAQSVFAALREKVVVNADQTPEYSTVHKAGHDGGDFIFTRK